MKKRFIALLLCCVMLFTLSPSLIASAAADDETVQQVEQTSEAKDTDQQPEQQPDQAQNEDKNETQATEEPKQETAPVEEDGADADEPAPAPAVVPVVEQNVPVTSEIVSPPVNFTDVAPFLDPVSGSSMRRAARNVDGRVVMYADVMTDSMMRAITETNRRRALQQAYNEANGITPESVRNAIRDVLEITRAAEEASPAKLSEDERAALMRQVEEQMLSAAKELEFEKAAKLRDQLLALRGEAPQKPDVQQRRSRAPRSRKSTH